MNSANVSPWYYHVRAQLLPLPPPRIDQEESWERLDLVARRQLDIRRLHVRRLRTCCWGKSTFSKTKFNFV